MGERYFNKEGEIEDRWMLYKKNGRVLKLGRYDDTAPQLYFLKVPKAVPEEIREPPQDFLTALLEYMTS